MMMTIIKVVKLFDYGRHQCRIIVESLDMQEGWKMKVTKAQAQANRARIVDTASTLFRERGYDGVGVADLMGAAGFTHGGFYKHFESKTDLMAQAAQCGMAQTAAKTEGVDRKAFVKYYLSRKHRDNPGAGCTMAALGTDAARQPQQVREAFADGIERMLGLLMSDADSTRAESIGTLAHLVGAIVLSRACPEGSPLADEILRACRSAMLPPAAS
jgi:TetR/AcrR family transcriptional repressor of nem operon